MQSKGVRWRTSKRYRGGKRKMRQGGEVAGRQEIQRREEESEKSIGKNKGFGRGWG